MPDLYVLSIEVAGVRHEKVSRYTVKGVPVMILTGQAMLEYMHSDMASILLVHALRRASDASDTLNQQCGYRPPIPV